ncbi:hypothetical protein [Methyloferula stellata]|uniref:hypothetical protein n=1 Tax=Methyloferula stellata TaxID=876270 RepID=UPI00038282BF|nr:hypothetical protein [Methyloferula stellata]
MISPHTPPGTKIVCIDADLHRRFNIHGFFYTSSMDGLTKDAVYTVRDVLPDETCIDQFEVRLVEIERPCNGGYALSRFRYLELPRTLIDLLNTEPVKDRAVESV